jgi:hypothetical protein
MCLSYDRLTIKDEEIKGDGMVPLSYEVPGGLATSNIDRKGQPSCLTN